MADRIPNAKDIKCIVSDVDGTLLDSNHQLHPRTISAIHKLRKTQPDLPFVICSGKAFESCEWIRAELKLDDSFPSIHLGGAKIYQGENGAIAHQTTLEVKTALAVVEQCIGCATFLFTSRGPIYINQPVQGSRQAKRDWLAFSSKFDLGVENCSAEPKRASILEQVENGHLPCFKITMCDESDQIPGHISRVKKYCEANNHSIAVTQAIPEIPEFMPPGVDKGQALVHLCGILGIQTSQVLAFGDGDNDIPLLSTAGYSVAMANAMSEPARIANFRTLSNDQGGVGAFLDKVFTFQA